MRRKLPSGRGLRAARRYNGVMPGFGLDREFAGVSRVAVRRVVDGESVEVRMGLELDGPVRRDDTIPAPVEFFGACE